jgi:hypothetical protein
LRPSRFTFEDRDAASCAPRERRAAFQETDILPPLVSSLIPDSSTTALVSARAARAT